MDDHVVLLPVREHDLPMLEHLTQGPERIGEFGWFGWLDPRKEGVSGSSPEEGFEKPRQPAPERRPALVRAA